DHPPLSLGEIDLFKSHADDTLDDLRGCITERTVKAGDLIYKFGQAGNEIYFVRKGCVNVQSYLSDNRLHHLSTIGRGDFFGGLSFLDGKPRGNEALVVEEVELYVLSRENFMMLAERHKRLAINILTALTRTLTVRLRNADNKLRMLYD
ncbi:MAG: cyclic nucleotide-binding domain-containing protein, partial [Magnetococcales bacterium]|nr:cyclic nucleotide-binding domain-containing protein [Magnetococcales bacterium]